LPYLTPQVLPEGEDCRPLFIPANGEWLALFGGALTELTLRYNWEYSGGLTIAETLDKMNEIINTWYDTPCAACQYEGGGKIIRVNSSGHIEELGADGTWGDATGDYVIPPPEAREGGTELDQNCLAAKNAENVLKLLYENLSESFAADLSEAEAVTAFIGALIAIVGFEFAPITFGIWLVMEVVFQALYQALAYLTADLWDESVSKQIRCFLLDCSINTDGVVTFDWDCFIADLNSLTDSFGLSEVQLRLYLQISYILYFIGGVDGLNLAGATTAITDDDCSDCDLEWCHTVDFTATDGGWFIRSTGEGEYVPSEGWETSCYEIDGSAERVVIQYNFPSFGSSHLTQWDAQFNYLAGSGGIQQMVMRVFSGTFGSGTTLGTESEIPPTNGLESISDTGDIENPGSVELNLWTSSGDCSGFATITTITFRGTGLNPWGADNCV
jgi:hypothetical protein